MGATVPDAVSGPGVWMRGTSESFNPTRGEVAPVVAVSVKLPLPLAEELRDCVVGLSTFAFPFAQSGWILSSFIVSMGKSAKPIII